jgi:hypothetical protein
MSKRFLYTVKTSGRIGIIAANSIREARAEANDELGRNNVESVARSTEEDIKFVRSMGGYIPQVTA